MRNSMFHLWIVFLFIACEEKFDQPLNSENINLIAVEGVLTNENINHKIKVSYPYQILNGKSLPVVGASIAIKEGITTNYLLTETPPGSGEYYTPKFRAVFGTVYSLTINYQGKEYVAQDNSEPVEFMQDLKVTAAEDRYSLVLNPAGQLANYIDHEIVWQNTPECISTSVCEGRVVFYDLKTIDVNEIYKPDKVEFSFPAGSMIIRRKYSVSPAYRSFLRSVLSETEWRGGVFDVDRANAPTNLSSGAIGFFAVSTVLADTTIVN